MVLTSLSTFSVGAKKAKKPGSTFIIFLESTGTVLKLMKIFILGFL